MSERSAEMMRTIGAFQTQAGECALQMMMSAPYIQREFPNRLLKNAPRSGSCLNPVHYPLPAIRFPPTSTARKSFTFVSVGPVTTESPSAAKNVCASLASRN